MGKEWVSCSLCGKDIERFPKNAKGERKSNFFCDCYCKGVWQRKQREGLGFTREWLEHQYIVLGKDANQIAREIGRDGKRVWEWIRDYGIPTRPRGSNMAVLIKTGRAGSFKGKKHTEETKERLSQAQKKNSAWKGKFGKNHPRYGLKPKSWRGGITPLRQFVYGSREWKDCVKAVWERDCATCQRCLTRKNQARNVDFDIHHIVSFEFAPLRCEPSNLVLLCEPCHYWVHSNQNVNNLFIKEIPQDESA